MHARMVYLITLPDKRSDLQKMMEKKLAPLLGSQEGLLEYLTLISDQEPRRAVLISIWSSQEYAEAFDQQTFPTIFQKLKPLLQTDPRIMTFDCSLHRNHLSASAAALVAKSPDRRKDN